MAIRTVVKGKLPSDIKYKGKCPFCQTQVECIQSDTHQNTSRPRGETLSTKEASWQYVRCPLCHNDMRVEEYPEFFPNNNYNDQRDTPPAYDGSPHNKYQG